jgi:hypothetical protein
VRRSLFLFAQTLTHDELSQLATGSLANGRRAMMARYRIRKNEYVVNVNRWCHATRSVRMWRHGADHWWSRNRH